MATELLPYARSFLSRSHFESLLSVFRPRSFAGRLEWFGRHRRECCIESHPRIHSEAFHVTRSQRGERPAIGRRTQYCWSVESGDPVQTVFPRVSEAQCKDSRLIFSSQLVFDPLLSHFFCKRSATVRRVPYGHRRLDSSVVCCSGAWLNGPVAPQHGMKKHGRWLSIACGIATLLGSTTNATELKSETAAAFDRYIQATETRTEHDLGAGRFLVVDSLPETTREQVYAELKRGQFYTVPLRSEENGKPIPVPGGLIHHWVGVAFIPAATLSQTLAVLQDYENHKTIYKPDVRDSKLLARDGNDFQVFLQFYRKSLVTVVV